MTGEPTALPINPDTLPALDIVALANDGRILRAERETPAGSLPIFLPAADWSTLATRFAAHDPAQILDGLEKALPRLMTHAAQIIAQTTPPPNAIICQTDLFEDDGEITIHLVRDRNLPVACIVFGTRSGLTQALRHAPGSDETAHRA